MLRIAASRSPQEEVAVPEEHDRARLREVFRRRHCLVIPRFLDPALAEEIAIRVEQSSFHRREHAGIGVEACMDVNATLAWLLLLVNDVRVLEIVRSITGCGPIGNFDGRVYRLEPSTDHHDSWHNDLGEGRLVAMSINLGRRPYEGGALEIRDRRSGETATAKSPHAGDALLFELGEHLDHRVLPVTGNYARTVFAGWFKAGPDFLSVLRSDASTRSDTRDPAAVN